MKKMLLLSVVLVFAVSLLSANFTAYGSARLGYWYDMEDDDWSYTGESRLNLDYYLQSNSRFGVDFVHNGLVGKVEFGGSGGIRHLWARYNFGTMSMLIGQTETGLNELSSQVYSADNGFIGYGAAWDGRRPMVMLCWDNGFYSSFIQPNALRAYYDSAQLYDILLPKINVGYRMDMNDLKLHFSGGFNMITYNDDDGDLDDSLLSFVLAGTGVYTMDQISMKLHAHFAQNAENYGLSSILDTRAFVYDGEIENVTSIGFFGDFCYNFSDVTKFIAGIGYNTADSDEWEDSENVMSFFLQMRHNIHSNIYLVPEIGMIDHNGDASKMYFGGQLRVDF